MPDHLHGRRGRAPTQRYADPLTIETLALARAQAQDLRTALELIQRVTNKLQRQQRHVHKTAALQPTLPLDGDQLLLWR